MSEWLESRIKVCEVATRRIERMGILEEIYKNPNTVLCPRFNTPDNGKAEIRFVGPTDIMEKLYLAMKGMTQG